MQQQMYECNMNSVAELAVCCRMWLTRPSTSEESDWELVCVQSADGEHFEQLFVFLVHWG